MLARCPACSERFPVVGSSQLACPFCRAPLEVSIERAASAPIEPSIDQPVKKEALTPWEERGAAGFFLTIWSVMSSPVTFFKGLGDASVGGAPSFALLILLPAIAVQAGAFLKVRQIPLEPDALIRYAGMVVLASMLSIAYLGAFYQVAASIMSRRRVAVPATVRALCFGFAPMVLATIPIAGLAVGLGWSLMLHAIALREMHGLTSLKSFAVVACPIALIAVKLW